MNEVEQRTMLDMARATEITIDDSGVDLLKLMAESSVRVDACNAMAEHGSTAEAIQSIAGSMLNLERFIKKHPETREVMEFILARHYFARGYYSLKLGAEGVNSAANVEVGLSYYRKALAIPNLPPEFTAFMRNIVEDARAIGLIPRSDATHLAASATSYKKSQEKKPVNLFPRRIVITGILAAVAILLSLLTANATIWHVPAIIGGVLVGPVVGLLVGGILGLFSFRSFTFVIHILSWLFIGVAAYYSYAALKNKNEYIALTVAGVVGTLTAAIPEIGMALSRGYLLAILPHIITDTIIAAVLTVVVVTAWKRIESGGGRAQNR
jgi:uncharacterized membrane protein